MFPFFEGRRHTVTAWAIAEGQSFGFMLKKDPVFTFHSLARDTAQLPVDLQFTIACESNLPVSDHQFPAACL